MNEELINTAFWLEGKLIYKKLKNRYRIFCMKCQRYEYVDKKTLKQIQASHICPMCFQEITPTTILEHGFRKFIMDDNDDGYLIYIGFRFGCKPRTNVIHVCRWVGGDKVEVRYIFCNMGYSFCVDWNLKDWRERSAQGYFYRFYSIHQPNRKYYTSKREYIYNAFGDIGYRDEDVNEAVKSNQKNLMIDNLMNGVQMGYVIAFDLKSYDEVYRYRGYMKENKGVSIDRKLNVHYLDYLCRNKIKLSDFYDYMRQCRELGFALDKPKDFQHRHWVLSQMLIQKKNEEDEIAVKKRYARMLKKTYTSGNIQILPFKDADEIRKCGKQLHNCIGTYVSDYARKETDLYYLKQGKKIMVAIEVRGRKLRQARTDHNGECPPALLKHIRKWCSINGIEERNT